MAAAFGTTFLWVMGITAVALLPTLVLAGIERRGRRRPAEPARAHEQESPLLEAETRELALESA
jgi:hypothetical protein